MENYLSVAEAAARLGVSRQRILQLLQAGGLQGERVTPKAWLVEVASVNARLADRPAR